MLSFVVVFGAGKTEKSHELCKNESSKTPLVSRCDVSLSSPENIHVLIVCYRRGT